MRAFRLLLLPAVLLAQPRDGELLNRTACVFPAFEKLKSQQLFFSEAEYDAAHSDPRFSCEKLTYSSTGIPVVAYLYQPAAPSAPAPVVIFNRGSYIVNNQLPYLVAIFHRLAEAGFTILAPMYRGSDGAPGRDEVGGADLADLMNTVPLLRTLPNVDLDRLFLYGESRGGVMCLLALRDRFPARAAATFGAITDMGAYLEHDTRARALTKIAWPGFESNREAILASRSALQWPEKLKVPLFLIHGGADPQVDPAQTLQLALRLQQRKQPYALTIYPGADHILSQVHTERDQAAIRWFQQNSC